MNVSFLRIYYDDIHSFHTIVILFINFIQVYIYNLYIPWYTIHHSIQVDISCHYRQIYDE